MIKKLALTAIVAILSSYPLHAFAGDPFVYSDDAGHDAEVGLLMATMGAGVLANAEAGKLLAQEGKPAFTTTINPSTLSEADWNEWADQVTRFASDYPRLGIYLKPVAADGLVLENESGLAHLLVRRRVENLELKNYLRALRAEGPALARVEVELARKPATQALSALKVVDGVGFAAVTAGVLELLRSGYLLYASKASEAKVYNGLVRPSFNSSFSMGVGVSPPSQPASTTAR